VCGRGGGGAGGRRSDGRAHFREEGHALIKEAVANVAAGLALREIGRAPNSPRPVRTEPEPPTTADRDKGTAPPCSHVARGDVGAVVLEGARCRIDDVLLLPCTTSHKPHHTRRRWGVRAN